METLVRKGAMLSFYFSACSTVTQNLFSKYTLMFDYSVNWYVTLSFDALALIDYSNLPSPSAQCANRERLSLHSKYC